MSKLFLTAVLILGVVGLAAGQNPHTGKIKNPTINYVPPSEVKKYPLPPIYLLLDRDAKNLYEQEQEVLEKVVYPIINESKRPIASVTARLQPGGHDLWVEVIFYDGMQGGNVKRDKDWKINKDAYKNFLPGHPVNLEAKNQLRR